MQNAAAGLILATLLASCTEQAISSERDIREGYVWCVHRYHDHATGPKYVPGQKWMPGFEACQKIVDEHDGQKFDWADRSKHKSNIDAIAAGIKQ